MLYKKITMIFEETWLKERAGDETPVIESFITCLKNCFVSDIDVLSTEGRTVTLLLKADKVADALIAQRVNEVLKGKFEVDTDARTVTQLLCEDVDSKEFKKQKSEDEPQQKKSENVKPESRALEAAEEPKSEKKKMSAIDKIHKLVGAVEFKQLADELVKIAPQVVKYNTHECFAHQCYVFSINDGYGLTTYLNYFAELLSELKLFDFGTGKPVIEERLLPPQGKEGSADPFEPITRRFGRFGSSGGKLMCIDMSEWMTKTNDQKFRDFLSAVEDNSGQHIIVFRVPFVEKEVLNGICKNLGDQLFIRDISFVPLTIDELTTCAKEALEYRGFTAEDDVWKVFETRIAEEKRDGKFYGINTVNKIVREMIYHKQLSNALAGIDNADIKRNEILKLASYNENERTGIEMLDELVGMESIKKRIEEIVAQIELSSKNRKLGSPCIHMRFVGNPGTGKTTAARVIGKILREKGILRNGNFFEYAGRDFCGRYVGETAPKTAGMCRDAYGSVMFIDEAYSLYSGDGRSTVDYGKEAVDTLIAEMENHRSDLVVIMAGYPDDMDILMKANSGLESRMPFVIEFPNYTREQLLQIFMQMASASFAYDEAFSQAARDYFENLPEAVITSKEFSNARFVRNLFERTWGKAVLRTQMERGGDVTLSKEDFIAACSDGEFRKTLDKRKEKLGFGA